MMHRVAWEMGPLLLMQHPARETVGGGGNFPHKQEGQEHRQLNHWQASVTKEVRG